MALLVAASLFDVLGTAGDLSFVVRLMAFAYIVYYLFVTFNEQLVIFGLTAVLAGYFLLFHSPIVLVIAVLVLFIVFGSVIQMSLVFGLTQPHEQMQAMRQQEAAGELQNKIAAGATFEQLSAAEQQQLAEMQAQSQMQEMLSSQMNQMRMAKAH